MVSDIRVGWQKMPSVFAIKYEGKMPKTKTRPAFTPNEVSGIGFYEHTHLAKKHIACAWPKLLWDRRFCVRICFEF